MSAPPSSAPRALPRAGPSQGEWQGYLRVAGAAACWGAAATLGRAMFTRRLPAAFHVNPLDPLLLTQVRNTLAFFLLAPLLACSRRGRIFLPRAAAGRAALLGVLGLAATNYLYYLSVQRTTVAVAVVLKYTAPVWVLVYLAARRVQPLARARLAAVGLALVGIALVMNAMNAFRSPAPSHPLDAIGVAAALLAALAFAFYNLAGAGLSSQHDPALISLAMLGGAALALNLVFPPWKLWAARLPPQQWVFLLVFTLLATLLPTLLYISALRYLDPARAVMTSCLEPVAGILAAACFLGETLTLANLCGAVCVLAAIALAQLPQPLSKRNGVML